MNLDRFLTDATGVLAGLGILVGLALTEPARLSPPIEREVVTRPPYKLCQREKASHDIAWVDGKRVIVSTHWRRTVTEPCWYEDSKLSSETNHEERP